MATLMQKDVLLEAVAIATAKISKSYEKIDETQRINDRVLISKKQDYYSTDENILDYDREIFL